MTPPSVKELIPRLPRTFGPALNDQLQQWDMLFPAEQRLLTAQIDWIRKLPEPKLKSLFEPVFEIEQKMDLPRTAGLTIEGVGILARSPLYPQWRGAVEKVFAQIDDAVQASGVIPKYPRLLVCVLPSGLPLGSQPLWPELSKQGAWVELEQPFGEMLGGLFAAVAKRRLPAGMEELEGTWVLESSNSVPNLAQSPDATVLDWTALSAARREFLNRLNTIQRDLKAVDQANEDLRRLDLSRLMGPPLGARPRIREFVRHIFLSGNGSLVFGNSFVQWGSAEAIKRAQPQALLACFGMRPKLKPFSSAVLFEDQSKNPLKDEDDPAGTLMDALLLSKYVYLASQAEPAYEGRTVTLMAAAGLNRMLVLGPAKPEPPLSQERLTAFVTAWLSNAR